MTIMPALKTLLNRPVGRIAIVLAAFVVVMTVWTSTRTHNLQFERVNQSAGQDEALEPTEPMDFELMDEAGKKVRLSDFRGKPVLLNFWASWCPPCIEEMPSLLKFAEMAKNELGLVVLAVSVDESWPVIRKMFDDKKFWPRKELPLTILLNATGNIPAQYGTTKFPESYFITRDHKMIRKFIGAREWTSQEVMAWVRENSR